MSVESVTGQFAAAYSHQFAPLHVAA